MAIQQGKLLQAEADIGGSTVVLCMAETAATRDGKDAVLRQDEGQQNLHRRATVFFCNRADGFVR